MVGLVSWLVMVLFIPVSFALGYVVHLGLGGATLPTGPLLDPAFGMTLLGGAIVGLVFGGLSEELGWRGYLLPELQSRMNPLQASLIVAIAWSLWHLDPDFVAAGFRDGWAAFFGPWRTYMTQFIAEAIPLTLIMTALWNRSGGSLFAMVAIHSLSNAFISAIPEEWRPLGPTLKWSLIGFEWVFAVVAVGWLGEFRRMVRKPTDLRSGGVTGRLHLRSGGRRRVLSINAD